MLLQESGLWAAFAATSAWTFVLDVCLQPSGHRTPQTVALHQDSQSVELFCADKWVMSLEQNIRCTRCTGCLSRMTRKSETKAFNCSERLFYGIFLQKHRVDRQLHRWSLWAECVTDVGANTMTPAETSGGGRGWAAPRNRLPISGMTPRNEVWVRRQPEKAFSFKTNVRLKYSPHHLRAWGRRSPTLGVKECACNRPPCFSHWQMSAVWAPQRIDGEGWKCADRK